MFELDFFRYKPLNSILLMDQLKTRIKKFNEIIDRTFDDDEGESEYRIEQAETSSKEELKELSAFFDAEIPQELLAFYLQIGGIRNHAFDVYGLNIPPAYGLLKQLKAERRYEKRQSMGLIDGIKHSWSNDRPEFSHIPESQINYINANYKCIGLHHYDWQFEEAFYIYFDKNHQFGLLRYHQDKFDTLWHEHLTPLLTESQANQTLEQLLIQVLDRLEEGILNDFNGN